MKLINELNLKEKRVLIRVDFNVPLDKDLNITDDSRIRGVLPTINYATQNNAKIILMSHLGRPKGEIVAKMSLAPAAKRLSELLEKEVKFATDCIGDDVKALVSEMRKGDVLLLENLRFHPEEQKNDADFAKKLASLCDIYVNDAFAVCHRAHASVEGITKYAPVSAAGFLLQKEIDYFKRAMENPERPLVAIVGGAKISSKLNALKNMLKKVDKILIGGAMANTFLKAQNIDVGKSLVEDEQLDAARIVMQEAREKGLKLYIPVDAVIADAFSAEAKKNIVPVQEVLEGWMIMDIGPATAMLYEEALKDAKTIVWNGPMGVFEMDDAYENGTIFIAKIMADSEALTIVGGGDTNAALQKSGKSDKMSYISTGGGAFLKLLEGKTLPGIGALE